MNLKKIIHTILSLTLAVLLLVPMGAEAAAPQNPTKIYRYKQEREFSYIIDPEKEYTLAVKVYGRGTLYDGQQKIRKGILEYHLPMKTRKSFYVEPDKGYALERMSLIRPKIDPEEKISIMDRMKDGRFWVDTRCTDLVLEVVFQDGKDNPDTKLPETMDSQGMDGSNGNVWLGISPKTGDSSLIEWYLTATLLAAAVVIRIAAKKRKKQMI